MKLLQRVTTEYVDHEDRFRIRGEYDTGETVTLWLTQRLLFRLLPHLFNWLSSRSETNIPLEIVHQLEQNAASAKLEYELPVKAESKDLISLIHTVDLNTNDQFLRLIFKFGGNSATVLMMNSEQTRQWLSILNRLWTVAEWPSTVWPDWIRNSPIESDTPVSPPYLH